MKVIRFETYRFELPLSEPLVVGMYRLTRREGRIVELGTDTGGCALGEISPLPGVNEEDMEQVTGEIARFRSAVMEREIPHDLDGLSGAFEQWLTPFDLAPSVRFGIETAVLGLIAGESSRPLCALISDRPRADIAINALLTGGYEQVLWKAERLREQGYRAFKLKVGKRFLEEDIRLAVAVKEVLGDGTLLRLDANRAWNLDQAIAAANALSGIDIDYIEEPVHTEAMLKELASRPDMTMPLALDETLAGMEPEELSFPPNVGALVLKPTVLGLERTVRLARRAAGQGIKAVISSSFESGFGLQVLSHLAASLNETDIPAGLGTASWFEADLPVNPLTVRRGRLSVIPLPQTCRHLKSSLLK